jgi:hypothetical protein
VPLVLLLAPYDSETFSPSQMEWLFGSDNAFFRETPIFIGFLPSMRNGMKSWFETCAHHYF